MAALFGCGGGSDGGKRRADKVIGRGKGWRVSCLFLTTEHGWTFSLIAGNGWTGDNNHCVMNQPCNAGKGEGAGLRIRKETQASNTWEEELGGRRKSDGENGLGRGKIKGCFF